MARNSRLRNFLGRASKAAKTANKVNTAVKTARRIRTAALIFANIWWIFLLCLCCICCFVLAFGMFKVKEALDNPFANATTVIKSVECATSSDPKCVVDVFFDKTVEHVSGSMNEN